MKDVLGNVINFGDYIMFISNNGFRFGRVIGLEAARAPYRLKNPPVPFIRVKVNGLKTTYTYTATGQQQGWGLQSSWLTASNRVIKIRAEQIPPDQLAELTRLMGW